MSVLNAPYRSWGRPIGYTPRVVRPRWREDRLPDVGTTMLPFGNGRSYGDSCLNRGGVLLDGRGLDRFMAFDRDSGVLRCEAGLGLSAILEHLVPQGWFPPVTPGTQHVTVGGAIANDVHGKNHHVAGSFGHHVLRLSLLRSDGARIECSRDENPDWFHATIGGLGLTGMIVWADIRLKRVPGPGIDTETLRFETLAEFFELSRASRDSHEYTVAWVDSTTPGPGGARGLLFRGNHAVPAGPLERVRRLPGVPVTPPVSLLPKPAIRLFNSAVYHRSRKRRRLRHYAPFFYPLDAVANWNRLFGARGFYQYQCVVPHAEAADAIAEMMRQAARTRAGSFLSVLKEFGDQAPAGLMSFPRPGVTLAIDFPDRGEPTRALLERLDDITVRAGGAVYPAKDARMSARTFQAGYPDWQRFEGYRDPAFISDFWRRVTGKAHE